MAVTWNPSDKGATTTLSNGNLSASITSWPTMTRATLGRAVASGGKYYFEVDFTGRFIMFGVSKAGNPLTANISFDGTGKATDWAGGIDTSNFERYGNNGALNTGNSHTYAAGKVLQVAVDFTAGKIWFGYDNTWFGSGVPASGTGAQFSNVTGAITVHPAFGSWGTNNPITLTGRFKTADFSFTPPSGFGPWDDTIEVALTGQAVTVQRGALATNPFQLSGQQIAIQQDGVTPIVGYFVALTGQSVSVQQGAVFGAQTWALAGQSLSMQQHGFAVVAAAPNVVAYPEGMQIAVASGALAPLLSTGNTATTTLPVPRVVSAYAGAAGYDPFKTSTWAYTKSFISYEGALRGVGDVYYQNFGVAAMYARRNYAISQSERLLGSSWSSTLIEAFDYRDGSVESGPNNYAYDPGNNTLGNPEYLNSGSVYPFNTTAQQGGHFSIGRDGSLHWAHQRGYTGPLTYFVYQNSFRNHTTEPGVISIASSTPAIMGLYAHDQSNALIFYKNASSNPAYRHWDGSTWGSEVALGGWTGSAVNNPASGYLTVVRAGYGDTIYLVYKTVGDVAGAYIGTVVMDAVTGVVTSHVLTHVSSTLTKIFEGTGGSANAQIIDGHRPLAEVAVLSSGVSVTQFAHGPAVVHVSWTSGTATMPTFTLKTVPASTHNGYAVGWETLEIRDDVVTHVMYEIQLRNSGKETATFATTNDATGAGSTWSTLREIFYWGDTTDQFPGTTGFNYRFLWLSGYGGGGQTYLYHQPHNEWNLGAAGVRVGRAWVDWWGGYSYPVYTKLGTVTVAITVALVGQQITVQKNHFDHVTAGANVTAFLDGASLTIEQGRLSVGLLIGQQVTVQRGALVPGTTVPLTGMQASVQQGSITPSPTYALQGAQVSVQAGVVQPLIACALAGVQVAVQQGVAAAGFSFTLAGLGATVLSGTVVPVASLQLSGASLQVTAGALVPALAMPMLGAQLVVQRGSPQWAQNVPLVGLAATVSQGVFGLAYDCRVVVVGFEIVGMVGVDPTVTNSPPISSSRFLYLRRESETLFVRVTPETSTAQTSPKDLTTRPAPRPLTTRITPEELTNRTNIAPLYNDTDPNL